MFDAQLKLFLLEKVLCEIRYAITNRPDWLEIPREGALRPVMPEGQPPPTWP